ncbi:MAG: hypothetical protein QM820_49735 [Minicystis sp.]
MRHAYLPAFLLAACGGTSEPTPSTDLATSELALSATVRSNGNIAQAQASLSEADYSAVLLRAPDRLLLAAGGVETPFVSIPSGYVGQLATTETDFAVIVERAGGVRIKSALSLPPPFVLIPPPPPVSLSQPMTFTWDLDPGDFQTSIRVTSPCFAPIQRGLTMDTGGYTLQPADLAIVAGVTTCDVEVEVTRSSQSGTIAVELAPAGSMSASQIRTIQFSATP